MRFRFIEDHRSAFPVRVMCVVLEVSASGYFAWRSRPKSARTQSNQAPVDAIRRVHMARCRRRFQTTTDGNYAFPLAANLLARQFTAPAPNRVWLADSTFAPTDEG
jgi:transposase InsO family protein